MGRLRALRMVVVAAAACAGGCGDSALTEDEFWDRMGDARDCVDDFDCAVVVGPCGCLVSVNQEGAAEFVDLADEVACDGVDDDCAGGRYPLCHFGQCVLSPDPRPPTQSPCASEQDAGCNPAIGTGCGAGQKCAYYVESVSPRVACTTCVPDGSIAEGGACTVPEIGADDCAARLSCLDGTCTEICFILDHWNCDPDESCVRQDDVFVDADTVGLCEPSCNPVAAVSGCADGEGCYPDLTSGRSTCYPTADCPESSTGAPQCATDPGTQGCACEYISCCRPGHACALNNDPVNATGLLCAFLCDASASGGPTCADGPGASYECRQINQFYDNTQSVPDAVGMCVDPIVWP